MLPTLREVLDLRPLRDGEPIVRAGRSRLDAPVRWVHVSEIGDIGNLLEGGELILSTGVALPESAAALARFVTDLAGAGVCGIVVELGRRFHRSLPAALVDAAHRAELPLVELHRETPFVAVTQAVHTLILAARMRELEASDERQRHRTLLTTLALAADVPPDLAERAGALGVPLHGRALTGVAVRTGDGGADGADPALLRDIANRAADTLRALRVPALVGLLDDQHVAAVVSLEDAGRTDAALRRLCEQVHAVAEVRGVGPLVVGVGTTTSGAPSAAATLREAVRVADTAATLPPRAGWFRSPDLRLQGLVHQLRDHPSLRDYVERELRPLLDRADADRLLDVLTAYCRTGASKTDTAAALFVSRASLYDRLRKLERILGVDLADPDVVLGLHFALLARETLARPDLAAPHAG
ncbi:Sugar diacid utilization regulator [Jatrophihabitans endophyticus]|uniref:Sugar diacid utilization regulator n=1 Tax=Jatrophihabitans endophyticus TaxID=1206085 RepID=A0A1M5P850_9ACTN|nr:PucR family transcriptional regulator [Jatrophihabitans endophyticus]SHG97599.1 Sugar diacid utilization regulator [Jatrophihabitans endophyticus]